MARLERTAIHVIRAPVFTHFACRLEAMGAPVGQLLSRSGISAELLEFADTLVPLANAFEFLELACSALGTEHPGLDLGLNSSLADFGDYGRSLLPSPTVGAYFQAGVRHFGCLNSGERIWLSRGDGSDLRVNIASTGNRPLGAHQSHLCMLIVTILTIRQAAGPDWCPRELGLAYRPREPLPPVGLFAGTRIVYGTDHSYITVPSTLRQLRFPRACTQPEASWDRPGTPLPTDILAIVTSQIETLCHNKGAPKIDTVAESLSMSRRTLQREISRRGTTYGDLLHENRMQRACDWLDRSDRTVTEIAFELGYTDASNFTRAFRRDTGVSPSTFRQQRAAG